MVLCQIGKFWFSVLGIKRGYLLFSEHTSTKLGKKNSIFECNFFYLCPVITLKALKLLNFSIHW